GSDRFADALDRGVDDETVRGEWFSYLVSDVAATGGRANFDRYVTACVSAWGKEIRMNDYVLRAQFDELSKALRDCWVSNLEKRADNQWEAATLANALRSLAHIFVGLFTPAPMSDHQHRICETLAHSSLSGVCGEVPRKITKRFPQVTGVMDFRNVPLDKGGINQ